MKDLDYVYDKFEGLLLFLQAEVNGVEDCDEFVEAKKALVNFNLEKLWWKKKYHS